MTRKRKMFKCCSWVGFELGCPMSKILWTDALTSAPSLLLEVTVFLRVLYQWCRLFRRCISIWESAIVDSAIDTSFIRYVQLVGCWWLFRYFWCPFLLKLIASVPKFALYIISRHIQQYLCNKESCELVRVCVQVGITVASVFRYLRKSVVLVIVR